MKTPSLLLLLVGMVTWTSPANALQQSRLWTDREGRSIQASIRQIHEDSVTLILSNGRTYDCPIEQLSDDSQQLLSELRRQQTPAADSSPSSSADIAHDTLNDILELPLWGEESLWEESAADVASRIRVRLESQTSTSSSYRKYTRGDERVLGTYPFSIALYAENDKLQELSLVFANKGDTPEDYAKRIDEDGSIITERLQNLLGQPRRERSQHERFLRWDANGCTFLLVILRNEYVALRILPTAAWVDPQKARIPSGSLKRMIEGRIHRTDNGDVLIKDIPMVDQGPKGYCVPATFERTLRYFGIPADMYTLAMIGQSSAGGGTSMSIIQAHLQGEVRRNGRRWDSYRTRITIDEVKRWIDQGSPILWRMRVYDSINHRASLRSMQRATIQNLADWAKNERPTRNVVQQEIRNQDGGAHLCMIIGYNRETGEVAISDSWGPQYEVRWIFDTELEAISGGEIHVITP